MTDRASSDLNIAASEFILGGQKSGKSRRGESLAAAWLARSPAHKAVMIATAQAWDDEMHQRIEPHQRIVVGDVFLRLPGGEQGQTKTRRFAHGTSRNRNGTREAGHADRLCGLRKRRGSIVTLSPHRVVRAGELSRDGPQLSIRVSPQTEISWPELCRNSA